MLEESIEKDLYNETHCVEVQYGKDDAGDLRRIYFTHSPEVQFVKV